MKQIQNSSAQCKNAGTGEIGTWIGMILVYSIQRCSVSVFYFDKTKIFERDRKNLKSGLTVFI
jgi:hypothetical protein